MAAVLFLAVRRISSTGIIILLSIEKGLSALRQESFSGPGADKTHIA